MKILIYSPTFVIVFLFIKFCSVYAQDRMLMGIIQENRNNQPLNNVNIYLLNKKDSTVSYHTISNENGLFNVPQWTGRYQFLKISHVGYQRISLDDFEQFIKRDTLRIHLSRANIDLDTVKIPKKKKRIRGDTVEYDAAFLTKKRFDDLESIMLQLPGLRLNDEGELTLHGNKVNKIWIDGRSYYLTDPKAILKNIPAELVDKIQFFNERELGSLRGQEGAIRGSRTINITTRADKQRSRFGQANLAASPRKRYYGNVGLNIWEGAHRIGISGGGNNITTSPQPIPFSASTLSNVIQVREGDPKSIIAILGYDGELKTGDRIQASFGYTDKETDLFNTSQKRYLAATLNGQANMEDRNYLTSGKIAKGSLSYSGSASSRLQWGLSSDWNIHISRSEGHSFIETILDEHLISSSNIKTKANKKKWNGSIGGNFIYYLNETQSRSITGSLRGSLGYETNEEKNKAHSSFFDSPDFRRDTLDHFIQGGIHQEHWIAKIRYQHAIGESLTTGIDYEVSNSANFTDQKYYSRNKLVFGQRALDSLLSDAYLTRVFAQKVSANSWFKLGKWGFNLALIYENNRLKNRDRWRGNRGIKKAYRNVIPRFSIDYTEGGFNRISLGYYQAIQLPTVEQMIPFTDASNPLNVYRGNPRLGVEKRDIFEFYFHRNLWNDRLSIHLTSDFELQKNMITEAIIRVDSDTTLDNGLMLGQGSLIREPLNNQGVFSKWSSDLSMQSTVIGDALDLEVTLKAGNEQRPISINGISEISKISHLSSGLSLVHHWNKFVLRLNYKYRKFYSPSTKIVRVDNVTQNVSGMIRFQVTPRFSLQSRFDYQHDKFAFLEQQYPQFLWNPAITYQPFKDARAEILLSAFDVLNNLRYDRTIINDFYVENKKGKVIGPFVMLSFTYKLEKLGTN